MSNSFSVVLRRDYLELIESIATGTEGKVIRCAATLIAYYRHWQEWKQEHQRTDWIYQPLRQLYKDLMGLFSIPVIRAANDLLIDLGLLERRGNPGNGQDKTYQYNVRFDRVKQLLAETCAVSSFKKTDVSVAIPNFSSLTANTHHNIQFNKVISSNHDAIEKNEIESNQKSITSTTQVEILTATKEQEEVHRLVAESLNIDQHSNTSLDGDEDIELAQQFLASLNTAVQRAECERTIASDQIRPIRIPGMDEETHEILWKHQATLEKLNADLNAERIKSAIADNPQHLEDAIEAFFENSAKGAKTKEAATGFLFNALRYGWKPRQSSCSASTSVQVYTPPPQMLKEHKPPTLEQLVERKRLMWQNASILRPGVEAWVQQTNGVIMTHDGPALADTTSTQERPHLAPNEAQHLLTPSKRDFTPPEENASSSHSKPDTSLAVVPPNRYSLVNYPTPPNNSPNPAPSLPPSSERALGVDENLRSMSSISLEKSKLADSSATSEPPTEPSVICRTLCVESNQPWYADRIKKPYEPPKSPFYVTQRVIYEDKEYLVAVPGNPHTQLEGLAKAVANFWITPVEDVHLTHEQNLD